jgi:hypothetical protein
VSSASRGAVMDEGPALAGAGPSFVPRAESTCRTVNAMTIVSPSLALGCGRIRRTARPPSGLVTDSKATMSYASPSPRAVPYPGLPPLSVRVEKDLAGQPGHLARSDGTCLRPAPRTRDRGAMTEDTLISLQSAEFSDAPLPRPVTPGIATRQGVHPDIRVRP